MKFIPLTQGKFAIVDDEDYDQMSLYKWHAKANPSGKTFYAVRLQKRSTQSIYMHNEVMGGLGIDHRNANGLDNQKGNLRFATRSQNNSNRRMFKNNTTGAKGVDFVKESNKYRARIQSNGRSIYLGAYKTLGEASRVYSESAERIHGEFAKN